MLSDLSPLWISLKTAALATVFTFFLGIAAAYWMLGSRGRWKSLIEGIFLAPLVLPPTVVGFVLLLLLGKNGAIGQLMGSFNFSVVFTWYAAVITGTVVSFPLMYKTALGAFEQIDANLLQVARTLGASEVRIFWRITLPLAIPGILAGVTLAFARALGEFGATLMLAGNIPGRTQTIPMAIFFAVQAGAMNEAWIWTIAIMGISLSGILAVNLWQESRRSLRGSHFQPVSAQPISTQPVSTQSKSLVSNLPERSNAGLVIDIQKQLPGFLLQISFSTQQAALGLLGASGAGKSMILRCIAGVETPDHGQIVLNGRVLFDSKQKINLPSCDRQIGFLVQNYALFPHLTVAENIAFGLRGKLSKIAIRQQITAQLEAVQLSGLENRYPAQLSGGQQQRVALARALASQPEALLLDEPFSALDTYLRSQLEQMMIARLSTYQGVTLFVTHNLEEAYRICENLLVLERGRSIAQGPKQSIFDRPATFTVAQLTGCKNFSVAEAIDAQTLKAIDWDCTLRGFDRDIQTKPIPSNLTHVGIRAHHITFLEASEPEKNSTLNAQNLPMNVFFCWVAQISETPHRVTLYLKLHQPPSQPGDYHLQAEVYKEKWLRLKDRPLPWQVQLNLSRLILMTD